MFGSALALQCMGVSFAKIEVVLELLFVCFQAMKQSGLRWPLITEADLDKQLGRYVATVRFGEDLSPAQRQRAMMQYLETHPGKPYLPMSPTNSTSGSPASPQRTRTITSCSPA